MHMMKPETRITTGGVRRALARAAALLLLAGGLALVPSPAHAAMLLWNVTTVTSFGLMVGDGDTETLTASCPAGKTPVSGGYTESGGHDVRRLSESVGFGSGASYQVSLVDFSPKVGGASISVAATVNCVNTSFFSGPSSTQFGEFTVGANHLAEGQVACPAGQVALSASVNFSSVGETLLTSTPTTDFRSWHAKGWNDVVGSKLWVLVHCVAAADLPGAHVLTRTDPAGWDTPATATCPSGLKPLLGGTRHEGGDGGAITIEVRGTATGWTSRTLSSAGGNMRTTVVCIPTEHPTVTVTGSPTPDPNSTTARWQFSATDPAAAGGYTMSLTCTLQLAGAAPEMVPCSSPIQRSGLPEGVHRLTVTAATSDGRGGSGVRDIVIDTTPPTVTMLNPEVTLFATDSPTFGYQVVDALSPVAEPFCQVDAGPAASCWSFRVAHFGGFDYSGTQFFGRTGVSDGDHVLHVRAADHATNDTVHDFAFQVDTTPPTVAMTGPTRPFTLDTSVTARWSGTDEVSGVAEYDVRTRSAHYTSGFGEWSSPTTVDGATSSQVFDQLGHGTTLCFSVRARDEAGHESGWSADSCTAVPLDDRDLTRSSGWTRSSPSGWFEGTALSTTTRGAKLSTVAAPPNRIALVAKKCRTCGTVGVYVAGALIGQVDLHARRTARKTVVLPAMSLDGGVVSLKVLSRDKLVQVDALGLRLP